MVHETPAEFAPLAQAALGHRAFLSKGSGHLPEPCREDMDSPALMRLGSIWTGSAHAVLFRSSGIAENHGM